ncbi:MAG: anhydro-N-acetylmuramic acid kinase [Flavobacteriales bacterium]|nr:anhydro-N-acetylmuramic acid kinase [Flavobacteriales bacterium]
MKKEYKIIGLMSGTSLDGLDMVYAIFTPKADGGWRYRIDKTHSVDYSPQMREKLKGSFYQTGEGLTVLDAEYGRFLGEKVKEFVQMYNLDVDFVASHGHTVFHRPDLGYNLQIGSGAHLHAISGQKVVCDFRTLDVAFGGQGAPLVPIGDKLLFSEYDYCLNIGGFANVSFDNAEGKRIAYDLCPANYVLNRLMRTRGEQFDRDGLVARSGKVNKELFDALNALEYYHREPPKSLAQEWVDKNVMPLVDSCTDTFENVIATLTEHSAYQISRHFRPGSKVLVTGGGAYNVYMLERALSYSDFTFVKPEKNIIDFKEALIFAFLGLRRVLGRPNCLASVTGASHDVVSGVCYGFDIAE